MEHRCRCPEVSAHARVRQSFVRGRARVCVSRGFVLWHTTFCIAQGSGAAPVPCRQVLSSKTLRLRAVRARMSSTTLLGTWHNSKNTDCSQTVTHSLSLFLIRTESPIEVTRGETKLSNTKTSDCAVDTLSTSVAATAVFKRVPSKTAGLTTPAFSASVVDVTTAVLSSGLLSYSDCSDCCARSVTWWPVLCQSETR